MPDAKISQGVRDSLWLQGMQCSIKGAYDCTKAFSETDFTDDLKKLDVPTLILHGDADQIVAIGTSAIMSAKPVKNATPKVYAGAPHGMCTTLAGKANGDLLAYFGGLVPWHGCRDPNPCPSKLPQIESPFWGMPSHHVAFFDANGYRRRQRIE